LTRLSNKALISFISGLGAFGWINFPSGSKTRYLGISFTLRSFRYSDLSLFIATKDWVGMAMLYLFATSSQYLILSSTDRKITSTPLLLYSSFKDSASGNALIHGRHQAAQRSTYKNLPFFWVNSSLKLLKLF